ncbi:signal peptidase II [Heliorestis convoluta]|uniref:signal peptidase II n=1 Tax=Heliorestis convoluta TaxID=356322 RepID=UPI001A9BBD89|nr:signal peptidase II [Heliorestis convoluta]
MLPQKISNRSFWSIVFVIVFIDQLTKWLVHQQMTLYQSIPLIPNIFHLTYIRNPGAAFGMLAYQKSFFIVITILILLVIFYFYRKIPPEQPIFRLGLALQGAGAIGNFIDRLKDGYVIDFFDFRLWPVFNIADIAISVGVLLLIYSILTMPDDEKQKT